MAAAGASDSYFTQREGVKYIEGVEEPQRLKEALSRFANVRGISAVVNGGVQITSSFKTENSPQVFGIVLEDHLRVSDLAEQITSGTLDDFRAGGVLIGRVLADRLQLSRGDSVVIAARGQSRRFRVAAIYETGYREVDKVNVYLHMDEARSLLKKPSGATFLQIGLHDPDRAPEDAAHMVEVLRHKATSWQEREVTWLAVFEALRVSTMITVSVFTLIASLAMFNTLAMIVLEKTKDIAILRSMGYERRDITQIFLWQAAIVLAVGAVLGGLFGGTLWGLLGGLVSRFVSRFLDGLQLARFGRAFGLGLLFGLGGRLLSGDVLRIRIARPEARHSETQSQQGVKDATLHHGVQPSSCNHSAAFTVRTAIAVKPAVRYWIPASRPARHSGFVRSSCGQRRSWCLHGCEGSRCPRRCGWP